MKIEIKVDGVVKAELVIDNGSVLLVQDNEAIISGRKEFTKDAILNYVAKQVFILKTLLDK